VHIESIALTNFQCFGPGRAVIYLEPGLTAFIGTNGAGKTAACIALQRLFGVTSDERAIRTDDFHVEPEATEVLESRSLSIEAVLAFPELDGSASEDTGAVPEFFHRMAADDDGNLKCRIVLEASWTADGTVDGDLEARYWVVRTFADSYAEDERTPLPSAERARVQVLYVPASRDGARQVTAFLRGRLWRAAQWSQDLRELVEESSKQVSDAFHAESATKAIEEALEKRWLELHGAGTHATPRFQPLKPEVTEMLRGAELVFEPDHSGTERAARLLSDGQRSLLHLALTTATLDIEAGLLADSAGGAFDMTSAHMPTLTVLAIEEPENSLAPFYLSRIITQVLAVCEGPRAQAVLASHSASVLNRVDPGGIRHFRLEAGTAVVRAITLPDNDTEEGKYVRQAVRAHPELYFARFVVLGEGDTEELVIPRIAQAIGVDLDPSFVAMVPLGGRHTNHFWKLLNDLRIPHATLLDLDWGRAGGGPARLRTAFTRLAEIEEDRDFFEGLPGFAQVEDLSDSMTEKQIAVVMKHLRQFNVYFSAPLDLDLLMLRTYFSSYTVVKAPQKGPDTSSDATATVLGPGSTDLDKVYWATADATQLEKRQTELRWYRYLFSNRSKPSTHLLALARLSADELQKGPEPLIALINKVKEELEL
jgi:hypothetical protein